MKNIVDIGKALFHVEPLPDGGHRRFTPEGCLRVTDDRKGAMTGQGIYNQRALTNEKETKINEH